MDGTHKSSVLSFAFGEKPCDVEKGITSAKKTSDVFADKPGCKFKCI
jgi:hypothetical protein